jgi:glycosyltransferase involved in cell wall biosynthesis
MPNPQLSVIVPARNAAAMLPLTLGAILGSDLPRERWELIVVDDASSDGTGAVAAKLADLVISVQGNPHGPGYARNRGVEVSRGEWVVFIDADVVAHDDTLRRFTEAIRAHPSMDAVFGAYDENPPAPGFLSRYRNLLHRYIHLAGAGPADTFWAGCGAVRRSAFLGVGGFDEQRYPRPLIEDIELGYRLRDAGSCIMIDPRIQGAHLKRWRFLGSIRTDVLDRGIPWVRLLLERSRMASPANLNLKRGERVKTVLVAAGLALLVGGLIAGDRFVVAAGVAAWVGVALSNLSLYVWFARQRGLLFALGVIPMNLWYYLESGVAVAAGVVLHLAAGSPPPPSRAASAPGFAALPGGPRTRRNPSP